MNAVIQHEGGRSVVDAHTAAEIKGQVQRIQEVMRGVMKEGAHYGTIPSTNKPTLYKAGSEILLSTFRIAVEPEVIDISAHDEIRYRVIARGVHMQTGITVGSGIGEASSSEEKYKWRRAVCDEEYNETHEDRRRIKFVKANNGQIYRNKQVRAEPADVANTVLKMAKKRAQIDMTLTALAASDIFAQDLEDLPEGMRETVQDTPAADAPQASADEGQATDSQIKLIRKKLENAELAEVDLLKALEVEKLEGMDFALVNVAMKWVTEQSKK